ncbi:MAG: PIN domain-containing protein [Armatimonadia bacterium]|nr:PIN domain-containing protein [Armatimonadia bacterium]
MPNDLVFLDANILVRAARSQSNKLRRLWNLPGADLCTSAYAAEESRRNTPDPHRRAWLEELLSAVRVIREMGRTSPLPLGIELAEKDRPILAAAIEAGATHLVTADRRHFGGLYETTVSGVCILPPSLYLSSKEPSEP